MELNFANDKSISQNRKKESNKKDISACFGWFAATTRRLYPSLYNNAEETKLSFEKSSSSAFDQWF
jgi:hypothetical protein